MKNGDNTISIVAIISVSYLDYLALRHPCSMVLVVLWSSGSPRRAPPLIRSEDSRGRGGVGVGASGASRAL